jgi:hypothetical protein
LDEPADAHAAVLEPLGEDSEQNVYRYAVVVNDGSELARVKVRVVDHRDLMDGSVGFERRAQQETVRVGATWTKKEH